jgi:hypothetical protein
MKRGRIVVGLLAAIAALVLVAPVWAQMPGDSRIVVTPYIGVYMPTSDVFRFGTVQNGTTVAYDARHQPAPALGASASVWLDDRFAIEASGLYSRNTLHADLSMNQFGVATVSHANGEADVWEGAVKLMVQALPKETGLNLRVGVGPLIITRGGPAYRAVDEGRMTGLTNLGGTFSLCTRVPLGHVAAIRLRAEDLVYRARQRWESQTMAGSELRSDPRTQHDFVASLGLQFGLKR